MTYHAIKPFWEIIPDIFRYPAKADSLLTIGLFSLLWLLAFLPGLVGFFISIVLTAATYKFAYSVLVHTARGFMDPPNNSFNNVSENVFWQQLGLWLLLGAAVMVIFKVLGVLLGLIAVAIVLVALPMATIILAIDQSIARALNPMVWLDGMSRIGMPYAAMVIFLLLLLGSSATMINFVGPIFPFLIGYVLSNFVSMYFLVAMFFLMGYVIYQYHEEFGWEPDQMRAEREDSSTRVDPLLAQGEELIEAGKIDEAKALLKSAAEASGPLSEVANRYWKLLKVTRDGAALTAFAKSQLEALMELDREDLALSLIVDCNQLDPEFKFRDGTHVLTFMQLAYQKGQHANVVALAKSYTKRYPRHADTAEVLYMTAMVLSQHLGRDEQALKILTKLRKAFPKHELAGDIKKLHGLLST